METPKAHPLDEQHGAPAPPHHSASASPHGPVEGLAAHIVPARGAPRPHGGGAGSGADDPYPRAKRAPIETVDNAALNEDAMGCFITAVVDSEGLVGHNIRAFNDLVNDGIPQILEDLFRIDHMVKDFRDQTDMDRQRESIRIQFSFSNVEIGRPFYATYGLGRIKPLYPNEARLSGRTYAAPLTLAAEVILTAFYSDGREETKRAEIPSFQVAPIPVMVGSDRCHTWNLTREARKGLEEDPNEGGGYFLAKGSEWVVDWLENIAFNALHVYRRMMANERVRGDFISQPGGAFENSSQVIIRYMTSGAITIEINSTKFSKSRIPFFVVFRLLGMASDQDLFESIVFDPASASPVARHMVQVVDQALQTVDPSYEAIHHETDREKLTQYMAVRLSKFVTNPTAYKSDEHAIQFLNTNLREILDRVLLPHMGRDEAARARKLRYLGMLIHKTLLVEMGILEPTDRDSLQNKRVHGAGVSIAKAFKTQFNNSVVNPVIRALKREVRNTPFEELSIRNIVDAFKNPVSSSDLSRTLEQAITSGNKTIVVRRRAITNRVSTQALERKNTANYYSALRTVSTHNASQASKQTERADMMRRVHATYTGYICVAKSADTGETVGMKKELAITASVCSAGEALPLKLRLLADPAVTPLDRVATPDIVRRNLAMVFVDGEWLGCCEEAHALVARYRALRREGRLVDPRTSIVWNPVTDDVEFLLDVGRMVRPLLIVDNNLEAFDGACAAALAAQRAGEPDWAARRIPFVQNTRFTPAHVAAILAGRLTLEDLRAEGVVEWVTPNEAANCLVASSLGVLRAAAHDVTQRYTHLDVEQAIFGLSALVSPFGDHTQPARVTYETNQGRQAGGWYCSAAPFRADKNRFFQHYCETPLVRTIAYNWLAPNGINTIVAYMVNRGYNQEDSAVVSAAFVQRGGFGGAFYRYEKAELEKGEEFRNPDITTTKNLKPNASYEKLVDGFVPVGAVVAKGDVLIGRVAPILAGGRRGARTAEARDDGYKFVDRSVVYHLTEPATVVGVFRPRGPNDNEFGLVKLRYNRPLGVGGKLSSRSGNKAIVALMLPPADMPFTEEGLTPDLIINPHCLAGETRVTLANGLSRRIDSLSAGGGEVVWGWDKALAGLVPAAQCGLMPKGREAVLRITLEDGRTLRATANHPVWTLGPDGSGSWTRAGELSADPSGPSRVQVGLRGPLDEPLPDEDGWRLVADTFGFTMATPAAREKTMAFARIVGFLLADGCIAKYTGYVARAYLGHPLDVDAFCQDVELVAGEPATRSPHAVAISEHHTGGTGIWTVDLPKGLRRAVHSLTGIVKGRRSTQAWTWPSFLDNAPVAVVREFIGGLFGGDGHSPCLVRVPAAARKAKGGLDRFCLKGVALTLTTAEEHTASMLMLMARLSAMLGRVGVSDVRVDGPVRRTDQVKGRVQCGVQIPPSAAFSERVGFRYCVDKTARLEAASAYWRMVETVKCQHDYVIAHTGLIHEEALVPLAEARDLACDLLRLEGYPLNAYYSEPPMSVINNRRRATGRQADLARLDYTRIADAETFFQGAGCLDWFFLEGVTGHRRTYVLGRDRRHLPGFGLRVVDVCPDGEAMVYDIGVPGPTAYCASGIVVSNSLPSRMTVGQMIETSLGLRCQEEGCITDGTAFRTLSMDEVARDLAAVGLRHNGLTRLYNGNTGEHYDAAIFMGPTFHQRLQKFVEDDEYAVGGHGPTDALTGQPLEGKNARGGLRIGEMEAWTLESHGSMMTLTEKVFNDSDGRKLFLCRTCGSPAIYNAHQGIYRCTTCGEAADIGAVDSCKASIAFQHEMRSANVKVHLGLRPREFEEDL